MLPEAKVTIYLQVANYLKPKLRFFLRTDFTVADKHEKMRGSKISHPAIYRGNRDSVCRTEDKISGSKKMETTVKSYHQAIYLPCLWEFFLSSFLSLALTLVLLFAIRWADNLPSSMETRQAWPKETLLPVIVNGYGTDRVVLAHVL